MIDFDRSSTAVTQPMADLLRRYIQKDQTARLTVSGSSMAPLLKDGDVIGLRYADQSEIRPGQIVTFDATGRSQGLTTHRIAAKGSDEQGTLTILTRGDHTLIFDPPWQGDAIVGQVVWRVRNGRLVHLDRGRGQWLNTVLGSIAERERALISGMPLANLRLTEEGITQANDLSRLRQKRLMSRLISVIGRSARTVLAFIISLFAGMKEEVTK